MRERDRDRYREREREGGREGESSVSLPEAVTCHSSQPGWTSIDLRVITVQLVVGTRTYTVRDRVFKWSVHVCVTERDREIGTKVDIAGPAEAISLGEARQLGGSVGMPPRKF